MNFALSFLLQSVKCVLLLSRLLNAFAEEQATEDAIYYMGEALRKGVIELDVFLKVLSPFALFYHRK